MRALLDERSSSALIERRRAQGVDLYDEIWEGTYVVNPAPSHR